MLRIYLVDSRYSIRVTAVSSTALAVAAFKYYYHKSMVFIGLKVKIGRFPLKSRFRQDD